jgi:hypothetical protein
LPDGSKLKYIAEQVSHHPARSYPPVVAAGLPRVLR